MGRTRRSGWQVAGLGLLVVLLAGLAGCTKQGAAPIVVQRPGTSLESLLREKFGSRLGRYQGSEPAVTFELSGGVSDADLCTALAIMGAADARDATFDVTVVRPDAGFAFSALTWDRPSGRLELARGMSSAQDMFTPGLAVSWAARISAEVPSGASAAALSSWARGAPVPWQKPTPPKPVSHSSRTRA
jgi:hypothetical protein